MSTPTRPARDRLIVMTALIAAGEFIFVLPFVVARIFRPTLLDVFGLTNLELGTAFRSMAWSRWCPTLPADRWRIVSPHGGLSQRRWLRRPGGCHLCRRTRVGRADTAVWLLGADYHSAVLGGAHTGDEGMGWDDESRRAYGILDGGRGFMSALLGSISVIIFAALLPAEVASATLAQRSAALREIIWIFTGLVLAVAVLVWFSVPETRPDRESGAGRKLTLEGVRGVLRMPAVWLQAAIVICAYVGFKSTDDFSLFARDAFGYDDVAAAQVGTISFWVRPFAAIGAGLLGDRIGSSRVIVLSFASLIVGSLAIALGAVQPGIYWDACCHRGGNQRRDLRDPWYLLCALPRGICAPGLHPAVRLDSSPRLATRPTSLWDR